jgi:hypothetical protein
MIKRLLVIILLFTVCLYSQSISIFYYGIEGNTATGFRKSGSKSRIKPLFGNYSVSYEDASGRERRLIFYKNGKIIELRKINTDGNITFAEGKSFITPSSWYEAWYTYRSKEKFKTLLQELDYKVYKNKEKREREIIHREITRFLLVKKGYKYWNVLYRRDFLPRNKLHHYWIYKFASLESEKPSEILEFDVNGKLLRKGKYISIDGKEVLVFKRA